MATEIKFWSGSINWAKVYEPDEYKGAKRWMVNFYPDDISEVEESGCQAIPQEDENGDKFVRIRRDTQKVIGADLIKFSPPKITGKVDVSYKDKLSGETVYSWSVMQKPTLELEQVGERVTLGNGTKVVLRVAVYDTQKGKGTRLESIEVKELVEYKPNETKSEKAPSSTPKNAAPWE